MYSDREQFLWQQQKKYSNNVAEAGKKQKAIVHCFMNTKKELLSLVLAPCLIFIFM
jgi:hypothetical protein